MFFRVPSGLSGHTTEVAEDGGEAFVRYRQVEAQHRNRVLVERHALVVVIRGRKLLHEPEGPLAVEAGAAVFLRRGRHVMSEVLGAHGGAGSEAAYESLLLFFGDGLVERVLSRPDVLRQAVRGDSADPGGSSCEVTVTPHLAASLDGLWPHLTDPEAGPPLAIKLEEVLAAVVAAEPQVAALAASCVDRDEALRRFVGSHFALPLGLAGLAALSGRSLATFRRDFGRVYGEPPGGWLRRRRLAHARALLGGGSCTVTEACAESGFGTLSHFVQAFRRAYGLTPKQYQLRARGRRHDNERRGGCVSRNRQKEHGVREIRARPR